jgi:hypothetical protein
MLPCHLYGQWTNWRLKSPQSRPLCRMLSPLSHRSSTRRREGSCGFWREAARGCKQSLHCKAYAMPQLRTTIDSTISSLWSGVTILCSDPDSRPMHPYSSYLLIRIELNRRPRRLEQSRPDAIPALLADIVLHSARTFPGSVLPAHSLSTSTLTRQTVK